VSETGCLHRGAGGDYACEQVTVPPWAIFDTHLDPPRLTTAIRLGCFCSCPDCAPMVAARHAVDGVPGYPPGVVWNPDLDNSEREAFLALPRRQP
jgi:hypothetical protein